MTTSPAPVSYPTDTDGWLAFVGRTADRIARVKQIDEKLEAEPGLSLRERLDLWNEAEILFREAKGVHVISEVHPDADVRGAAEDQVQAADAAASARLLDPALWRVFADASLAGLPQDFVDEHPADAEGLVTLTTEYPDLLPVLDYATDRDTRKALLREFLTIAWPENVPVLTELLQVRAERAALLGYPDWADYETETRMIGSGAAIPVFLDGVDEASLAPALRQYEVVMQRLRREIPDADLVTMADLWYLIGAVKREQFDVDAKAIRSYFPFERVRAGVLDTVGRLLDLEFVAAEVSTWHEDVRSYDVVRDGSLLGRIHLDLHPRDDKFSHAACFALVPGIAGRSLPEGVLACNFSRGLLDHEDVLTFFHEFGHLVHLILSGHGEWGRFGGFQASGTSSRRRASFLRSGRGMPMPSHRSRPAPAGSLSPLSSPPGCGSPMGSAVRWGSAGSSGTRRPRIACTSTSLTTSKPRPSTGSTRRVL